MDNGNQNPFQQGGDINQLQIAPNAIPGYVQNNNQNQPIRTANGGVISAPNKTANLIKTILLAVFIVATLGLTCLAIVMYTNWQDAESDVDGKVSLAVASAENKLRTKLEDEFAEKEKYPFTSLITPADLGSLSIEYPKTWSVYIPNDGNDGTNKFEAYLNPSYVGKVEKTSVFAIRLEITNTSTDKVKETYAGYVKKGTMSVSNTVVNGANVDVYTGTLPSKNQGIICIIKIRDKTATIQTDSLLFKDDFYKVLATVKFNA
jgi:hypothetical protein